MSNISEREEGLLKAYAQQHKQIEKLKAKVEELKAKLKLRQNPGVQLAAMRTSPGRKRSAGERCPCGQSTLKRARARGFDCCKKAGVTLPDRSS